MTPLTEMLALRHQRQQQAQKTKALLETQEAGSRQARMELLWPTVARFAAEALELLPHLGIQVGEDEKSFWLVCARTRDGARYIEFDFEGGVTVLEGRARMLRARWDRARNAGDPKTLYSIVEPPLLEKLMVGFVERCLD